MQSGLLPSTINPWEKGTPPGTRSGSGWSRFSINLRSVGGKRLDLVIDLGIVRPPWLKIMELVLPLPYALSAIRSFMQAPIPQTLQKPPLCVWDWGCGAGRGAALVELSLHVGEKDLKQTTAHIKAKLRLTNGRKEKNEMLRVCPTRAGPSWRPVLAMHLAVSLSPRC